MVEQNNICDTNITHYTIITDTYRIVLVIKNYQFTKSYLLNKPGDSCL